jgi:hypothetical protein
MKARKSLDAVRILRQLEQGREMDDIARGTATAALTLQSVILQALVYHGTMTPEALEVVDKAVTAAALGAKDKSQMEMANVTRGCLEGVREAIAEMMNWMGKVERGKYIDRTDLGRCASMTESHRIRRGTSTISPA